MATIALSSQLYALDGAVILRDLSAESDLHSSARRVTRTPTLDGGAHFFDTGYTAADRTITVGVDASSISSDQRASLQALMRRYAFITCVTAEGVFVASPESYAETNGRITLTLLVKEQSA